MVARQISAVDATIYMATSAEEWEDESHTISADIIALLTVIGCGIFILGFFLGACIIWKYKNKLTVMNDENQRDWED